jgi:HKD family nuclease
MNEYIEIIDDIIYNIDSQPTQQLNISLEEYIKKELSKLKQELTKCDELKAKV